MTRVTSELPVTPLSPSAGTRSRGHRLLIVGRRGVALSLSHSSTSLDSIVCYLHQDEKESFSMTSDHICSEDTTVYCIFSQFGLKSVHTTSISSGWNTSHMKHAGTFELTSHKPVQTSHLVFLLLFSPVTRTWQRNVCFPFSCVL